MVRATVRLRLRWSGLGWWQLIDLQYPQADISAEQVLI